MKNHTHTRPQRPGRQPQQRPCTARTPDPIRQHAIHRRLYTDFLALAMYPGMPPRRTDTAA
ncbi:MAG TPA: hypothetical protein VIM71_06630 [Lacunisphaera sp.]